ncbi:AGE family epimerase/isomerase [Actinomadura fibrosa]|uniref:AGE family epimerase/isomerase n=1 Tax=Actinomadura fibrosa TaxID=111802 RepID=A0ABW2XQ93_9ACTN|nr:AGE family epimerase/isomerase [Actinomadura fibrosa]
MAELDAFAGHPRSDTVAGRVTDGGGLRDGVFTIATPGGARVEVEFGPGTGAELLRNLGEPYTDVTPHAADLIVPGRYLFAHGIRYPGAGFEAKRLLLVGRGPGEYRFEEPGWWLDQLGGLARFYRHAQFGDGPVDFADYRTVLRLDGRKTGGHVQETDTISRLVYGMATAFLLTGEEEYLDVAEKGTGYLRDHMRFVDVDEDITYWYHGIEVDRDKERKLYTSEFSDDFDAIPLYEQIYALAGPVQLYRLTADRRIRRDIDATLRLIDTFFADRSRGGYFAHIDPILLSPHHPSLGSKRARKNWNSVGDHAPAYLVNLYLATGGARYARMLEDTADTIVERFPDPAGSPFVRERFHEDWTPDTGQAWQRDRAVVGHNLKIAWNLLRIHRLAPKPEYARLAVRIGETMPAVGSDRLRGGWYDVVERVARDGEPFHRFAWHDRKAWWQQEQAVLAYLVLHAETGREEFREEARAAAAFYNAFFLDHDEGAVYFNVLADGMPYLLGDERLKGSHAMSFYHTAELCYLAAVYGNLLIERRPMTFWFAPDPAGLPDGLLRVAPDLMPPGAVRIDGVEVDGSAYDAYDAGALTVRLPRSAGRLRVRVRLAPAAGDGAGR